MVAQTWSDEIIELRDKRTKSPGFFRPPVTAKNKSVFKTDVCADKPISAQIFPNGEFGVGFVNKKKISANDRRYEQDYKYSHDNAEIQVKIELDEANNITFYGREEIPAFPPPKLGVGAKSSQPAKRYGLKGITSYGRKMLRNAGYLIDKASEGRYNRLPQMGTLTVPSYSPPTMRRICANWGDIVRKFFQECKRIYARFRYRFDYATCTEIQPQRWAERREVGLHLHFLFVAIRLGKSKWVLPDSTVREVWGRILGHYLDWGDVPGIPNYRRDTVHKSSAAYLAKYASKGCEVTKEVAEEVGEEYLPRQWWSMSSGLRSGIKRHTILSQSETAEKLLVIARWENSEYIKYSRCIKLQTYPNEHAKAHNSPTEIVLGYGGLLSASGKSLFFPGNQSESIKRCLPRTLGRNTRYFKKYVQLRLTDKVVTS